MAVSGRNWPVMLLQPLDTSRFARRLMERIDLDLPFRRFVGLCTDRADRGASTTDPDARPDDGPDGQPSRPCAVGTGTMENPNGRVAEGRTTRHAGYAASQKCLAGAERAPAKNWKRLQPDAKRWPWPETSMGCRPFVDVGGPAGWWASRDRRRIASRFGRRNTPDCASGSVPLLASIVASAIPISSSSIIDGPQAVDPIDEAGTARRPRRGPKFTGRALENWWHEHGVRLFFLDSIPGRDAVRRPRRGRQLRPVWPIRVSSCSQTSMRPGGPSAASG